MTSKWKIAMDVWDSWLRTLSSNFALFFSCLIFSYIIYLLFLRGFKVRLTSGYFTMAVSMVGLISLSSFDIPKLFIKSISMEIIIIWLYLAASLIESYLNKEIELRDGQKSLNFGAFVLGTIIPLLLFMEVEPTLYGFILMQTLIGIFFWLMYLMTALRWFYAALRNRFRIVCDGSVQLIALSMQVVAILLNELFHDDLPRLIYQALILTGCFFYFIGLYAMIRYLLTSKIHHFFVCWSSLNVLCYAATAMTGLAMLNTDVFSEGLVSLFWQWTLASFIVVEIIEMGGLLVWINKKGLVRSLLVYRPQQWARIFAFAAIYAFNMVYHMPYASPISAWIMNYGIYVILIMTAWEMLLFIMRGLIKRFLMPFPRVIRLK